MRHSVYVPKHWPGSKTTSLRYIEGFPGNVYMNEGHTQHKCQKNIYNLVKQKMLSFPKINQSTGVCYLQIATQMGKTQMDETDDDSILGLIGFFFLWPYSQHAIFISLSPWLKHSQGTYGILWWKSGFLTLDKNLYTAFNPLRLTFFNGKQEHTFTFYVIPPYWHGTSNSNPFSNLPILHSPYLEYWCPGDARSQGISNHDIYYVDPNWNGPRTSKVKMSYVAYGSFTTLPIPNHGLCNDHMRIILWRIGLCDP